MGRDDYLRPWCGRRRGRSEPGGDCADHADHGEQPPASQQCAARRCEAGEQAVTKWQVPSGHAPTLGAGRPPALRRAAFSTGQAEAAAGVLLEEVEELVELDEPELELPDLSELDEEAAAGSLVALLLRLSVR